MQTFGTSDTSLVLCSSIVASPEKLGPAQPNLSMQGRTVVSLLRAVNEWHRQLGRETSGGRLQWRKSAFRDYKCIEGTEQSHNMRVWRIRELLSSQELIAEGRRMCHCVASYAKSCHNGIDSIWSMEVETDEGRKPLVTVEVNHQRNEICQVRGNESPADGQRKGYTAPLGSSGKTGNSGPQQVSLMLCRPHDNGFETR